MTYAADTTEAHTVFEVFYIDASTGWALAEYSFFDRDQIGEAMFCYHKRDAIALAKQLDADKAVRIFDRHHHLIKTVIGHA